MKKIVLIMTVLFVSLGMVFAGGQQSDSSGKDGSMAKDEQITLQWAVWDWDTTAYYQALVDGYEASHPNVKIEHTDLGSTDYMLMVQTQLAGGADFDVVTIKDIPGYANLIAQEQLLPLNSYISSAGIDTSAYGGMIEQTTVDGSSYELPFRSDFWVVYYNKDIFDEMGVAYPSNDMTLQDYDALARKLVHGEGNNKVYGAYYHTWRSAVQLFSILDGKNTAISKNYSFMKPTYETILKQQDDGIVMDYATAKSTSSHYRDLFLNSKIAMMNMGTWYIGQQIDFQTSGKTDVKNWGMVKYPHPAGVEAGSTLGTITGLAVNRRSEKQDAAFDFIKWISGEEGAIILASLGNMPALMSDKVVEQMASLNGFPTDANSRGALKTSNVYLEMPLSPYSAQVETVLNEEHEAIMVGSKTVDEGIAAMNKRVGAILP